FIYILLSIHTMLTLSCIRPLLADGEDSQSDGEDPDLATGTRTGMAGGCVGSIGGNGGTRKRKRHGNKMGKRERPLVPAPTVHRTCAWGLQEELQGLQWFGWQNANFWPYM
ncbi:hypothetical protein Vretifemale_2447, partial [Volvox reticuliferus]